MPIYVNICKYKKAFYFVLRYTHSPLTSCLLACVLVVSSNWEAIVEKLLVNGLLVVEYGLTE